MGELQISTIFVIVGSLVTCGILSIGSLTLINAIALKLYEHDSSNDGNGNPKYKYRLERANKARTEIRVFPWIVAVMLVGVFAVSSLLIASSKWNLPFTTPEITLVFVASLLIYITCIVCYVLRVKLGLLSTLEIVDLSE